MVNWASYNESLVRRGEVVLDFDVMDGWYDDLERMNEGKRGAVEGIFGAEENKHHQLYCRLRLKNNQKRFGLIKSIG